MYVIIATYKEHKCSQKLSKELPSSNKLDSCCPVLTDFAKELPLIVKTTD